MEPSDFTTRWQGTINGKRLPAKELQITGTILPDIIAVPREIHHGRQPCGTTAVEAICLRSLTNQTFPPGDLVSVQFDCVPSASLTTSLFPCLITQASDVVGNDVANPNSIPCAIVQLTP